MIKEILNCIQCIRWLPKANEEIINNWFIKFSYTGVEILQGYFSCNYCSIASNDDYSQIK